MLDERLTLMVYALIPMAPRVIRASTWIFLHDHALNTAAKRPGTSLAATARASSRTTQTGATRHGESDVCHSVGRSA